MKDRADAVPLLIRAGLLTEAEKLIANSALKDEGFIKVCQGELALARGQTEQAIRLLEDGTGEMFHRDDPIFFYAGFESLTEAYDRRGDPGTSLALLKQCSVEDEYRDPARVFWLRIKSKLLQRRRQLNQVEEARRLEDELK